MSARTTRGERGAVSVVVAIASVVLLVSAAFAVDFGNTWARRGLLQKQVDEAAVFAADELPAYDQAGRTEVANSVAQFLACNPVAGQTELDADFDAAVKSCTNGLGGALTDAMKTFAAKLLSSGRVSFPVLDASPGTAVRVVSPDAKVTFGLGRAAGKTQSVQSREAVAKIGSPGAVEPMGLSLECLLNAGANVLGGAGLPFGYIASPHVANGPENTDWPSEQPTDNQLRTSSVSPTSITSGGVDLLVTVRGSGTSWPGALATTKGVWVYFAKGEGSSRTVVSAGPVQASVASAAGAAVPVPPEVSDTPGSWRVKVATGPFAGTPTTWAGSDAALTVDPAVSLSGELACGRLLKSPRAQEEGTKENFRLNLELGLDHPVRTHPDLLKLSPPSTESGLSTLLSTMSKCNNSGSDVKDIKGNKTSVPNCMVMLMSGDMDDEFTEGLIGASGRLTCTSDKPCSKSFSLNGRSLNDDQFGDFVSRPDLLTSSTFFNASTYLNTGVPVVTPNSALSSAIYSSHRFMWVPVLSTVGPSAAGAYPILTFRPIFIAQSSGLDSIPQPPLVTTLLGTIDGAMRALLQGGTDQHGLIMKNGEVTAARFMTIEPNALPAVPEDYSGPVSNYLGVGPKIIRLVR